MCASGGQAGGTPAHLSGVGFLGGACVPSLVLGFRTPNLPLLPVREKGGGGMRGQTRTGMQHTTHRAQERSPGAGTPAHPGGAGARAAGGQAGGTPAPGSRVPGSRFSVLSSRFSVLGSQFSVLSSRFSVLSSRFSVLGSQFWYNTCVASTASAGARAYVRSTPAHCRYRLPRI